MNAIDKHRPLADSSSANFTSSFDLNDVDLADLANLPQINCLCELCDCGCFERTKQPHSLNCKNYLNKFNKASDQKTYESSSNLFGSSKAQSQLLEDSINSYLGDSNRMNPNYGSESANKLKSLFGSTSEYKSSFQNLNDKTVRTIKPRLKDTFSFGKRPLLKLPDTYRDSAKPVCQPIMTENYKNHEIIVDDMEDEQISSYNAEFHYYGNSDANKQPTGNVVDSVSLSDPLLKTHTMDGGVRQPYDSLNEYKKNYLRKFDETNQGFADNYSMSKGGVLLQIAKQAKAASANDAMDKHASNLRTYQKFACDGITQSSSNLTYDKFLPKKVQNLPSKQMDGLNESLAAKQHRDSAFRSVFIPKKYAGRNMFASHIDSTIFPEKYDKMYETQYNDSFDFARAALESKSNQSIDSTSKNIRYSMSNDNKFIPRLNTRTAKEIYDSYDRTCLNNRTNSTSSGMSQKDPAATFPSKSCYQNDFKLPEINKSSSTQSSGILKDHSGSVESDGAKVCKASLLKRLIQNNKLVALKYNQEPKDTLSKINKRLEEINKIIADRS